MGRGHNREALLERGLELIRTGGFAATGVQEIADAGGVPKGSFYNHFKSKTDFGVQILNAYSERAAADMERALFGEGGGGSPLGRLKRFFDDAIRGFEEGGCSGGCLVGNLAQEMSDRDPAFQAPLRRAFRRTSEIFARLLREAQRVGELSEDADPDRLARFLQTAWQGALMQMKAEKDARALREFRDVVFEDVLR